MPLPSGSGHPEFSAAHFVVAGVGVVVGIGVVIGNGEGVGAVGVNVVAGVGAEVEVGTAVDTIGAEQRAYTLAPAPPPSMRRRPGLEPMVFLQIDPDGANSVVPPHTELLQAE